MEQGGGISIISPPGITENSNGKSKSIGITLRSNGSIQNATKKLKSSHFNEMIKLDISILEAIRIGMGEMIGTAILVFIGCLGCVGSLGFTPPLMQICFAFGFAVMIAIQSVGHVSGAHINPAITVAALVTGNITLPKAILYVIAQCFGAIFGYGALKIITPSNLLHGGDPATTSSFCATIIHHDLSTSQGFIVEILATGILALFACGVWDIRNKKNTDSVPLRFAFCVSVLCFVFAPYTGCSMNPARSLAPAIWNGFWMDHWVFWLGPIVGSLISSSFYRYVLQPKNNESESTQDALGGVET